MTFLILCFVIKYILKDFAKILKFFYVNNLFSISTSYKFDLGPITFT